MASFQRDGKRWKVQVLVHGQRRSKRFDTKAEAAQWALEVEAEGTSKPQLGQGLVVKDALKKLHTAYVNEGKSRSDIGRSLRLQEDPIAKVRLTDLNSDHLDDFKERRAKAGVEDATIRREINVIRGMCRRCREDWKLMAKTSNPFKGFKPPKDPESRKRRVTPGEIESVRHGFGITTQLHGDTETARVGLMFLLACESAMRSGEMVSLTWPEVHLDRGFVHLPKTKNGDERDVPLTPFAIEIMKALPVIEGEPCFGTTDASRDALWRKIRDTLPVVDLHFHDSRSEGIWRLSKKLDVLQLARAIGHRDINSLLIYYRESAEDMAAKLAS
ncbi:site-specific integrase [Dyella sp. ASV21]|uniref:tyrosine-type recombinase/integrase n=1 Tax=Dyella sp. ASV21 TaxID=2795114 RepID=UPI0018ECB932|nr:site-specific integrase [Dyella sp. ASV21]